MAQISRNKGNVFDPEELAATLSKRFGEGRELSLEEEAANKQEVTNHYNLSPRAADVLVYESSDSEQPNTDFQMDLAEVKNEVHLYPPGEVVINGGGGDNKDKFKHGYKYGSEELKMSGGSDAISTKPGSTVAGAGSPGSPTTSVKSTNSGSIAELPPEIQQFLIVDKDTGEVYDMRNNQNIHKIGEEHKKIHKLEENIEPRRGKAWDKWWKEKENRNDQLLAAAEKGLTAQVEELLDHEKQGDLVADVDAPGLDHWSALHFAASENHMSVTAKLLDSEADVEARTMMGRTPLHIASVRGNFDIIKQLVNSGANINALDDDSSTPLHLSSESGHSKAVAWMLLHKPDISLKNNSGQTAIDVSLNLEVFMAFQKYDQMSAENLGASGKYTRTPLHNNLRHNARGDYIKRILYKVKANEKEYSQSMLQSSGDNAKEGESAEFREEEETKKDPPPVPKFFENLQRKVKIIDMASKRNNTEREKKDEKKRASDPNKITAKAPKYPIPTMRNSGDAANEEQTKEDEESIGPDSFQPLYVLGRGSFGEVYLVQNKLTEQLYAMKILAKKKIMGQNLVRYARTERDVLSYTKHPFIVGLHYAFQTTEKLFMLLDYCPGGDLGAVLQRERKISEERARIYISEVILALEHLHKRDIIFRDLKPDNIVIDEDGHALLTDFGLSKEGVYDNQMASSFCGSVAYLAPEMLRRQGHGKSVDWYLLGVVLYEMLVGQPPYFTNNREQLFKNIQNAPLKLPLSISKEARNLLTGLLSRNPLKRLGAKHDAREVKIHPWFKDIDWGEVQARKLRPPPPKKKAIPNLRLSPDLFEDKNPHRRNKINGWSFVSPEAQNIEEERADLEHREWFN